MRKRRLLDWLFGILEVALDCCMSLSEVSHRIHLIRGHRVMLDSDLAELYGVPTRQLNLAVQRNAERFPDDFMFLLTVEEYRNLKFQIETSSSEGHGGRRKLPKVFTEQGVAMLSSVLRSERAKMVFDAIRQLMATGSPVTQKKIDGLSGE